jgi:hypothetical protein
MPGHQPRPRRRTGRSGVKLLEADGLTVKSVQVGSLDERMTMSAQRRISLVVGQNKNNVGLSVVCHNESFNLVDCVK